MPGKFVAGTWTNDQALPIPARFRRPCRYQAFVPAPLASLDLRMPAELVTKIASAEAGLTELNGRAGSDGSLRVFDRLLLRTESIASSKIEGVELNPQAFAKAEAKNDFGQRIGSQAAEMIANVDAMQVAVSDISESDDFTVDSIVSVHRELMKSYSFAGRVRNSQNWIGGNDYNPCGADFVPPPPEDVARLLDDVRAFESRTDISPIVRAALIHAQFETIHPFADGNGRTGRALIHIVLKRAFVVTNVVCPVSTVIAREREAYFDQLTSFRSDDFMTFIEWFVDTLELATVRTKWFLGEVSRLQTQWQALLAERGVRAGSAARAIVEVLPSFPAVSVVGMTARLGLSKPAVNNAVADLEELGVLSPMSTGIRNRVWEPSGLLELVRLFEEGGRLV